MTVHVYDVVVVGGSFAGLNFARLAALSGLDVVVLERHSPIGSVVNTTGILPVEVLEVLQIPRAFLKEIPRRSVCLSPTLRKIELELPKANRWYMSDTGKVLAWLAEIARDAGAEIREGISYQHGEVDGKRVVVDARDRDKQPSRIEARYIIGADGALSRVARDFGLSRNEKILSGLERVVTGVGDRLDNGGIYAIFDAELAPGYGGWIAKHEGDRAQIGVAGTVGQYTPARSLEQLMRKFSDYVDPSTFQVERSLGGLMPVGGVLERVADEHAMLVGDAAGMCGPMACDGIFPSLISGMAASRIVSYYLQEGDSAALGRYVHEFGLHFNMGRHFKGESFRRKLIESFSTNDDLEWLLELWSLPVMQKHFSSFLGSHRYAPTRSEWVRHLVLPMLASPAVGSWFARYFYWRARGRVTQAPFRGPLLATENLA